MSPYLYSRLFTAIANLFPELISSPHGAVFYAPSRSGDDFSIFAQVSEKRDSVMVLDIADDREHGKASSPAVSIRVDLAMKVAEVITYQDRFRFEILYDDDYVNPRRSAVNQYVVNWLNVLATLDMRFSLASELVD